MSPDTQAILLLCGDLGDRGGAKPLTPKEYDLLAQWLREAGLRPGQLLSQGPPRRNGAPAGLDRERLSHLLERGTALALAVERWQQRGIWILGRGDEAYPVRLKRRLAGAAPPLIYGIGPIEVLAAGGLGVVGSRDADAAGLLYAEELGAMCAKEDVTVISGAARGVDEAAMLGALAAGGRAIGVLSDSLERAALAGKFRGAIARRSLTLISPVGPAVAFSVGLAMGRNRYIYTLADGAVVVHSGRDGGTWTGAKECIAKGWVPVYVRDLADAHLGNANLLALSGDVRPLAAERFEGRVRDLLADPPRVPEPAVAAQMGLFPPTGAREESAPFVPARAGANVPSPETAVPAPQPEPVTPEEFYSLFQRFMSAFAAVEPRTAAAIATESTLVPSQIKKWLARGVTDGWLRKQGRPMRYVLASAQPPSEPKRPPRRQRKSGTRRP